MDASLYRWTIKTSDDLYAGTSPGQVYLSLHGLDGAMKETLISQTKALGQFAKGSEDAGRVFVAENLGAMQTGTLRCTGRWKVDWVKVESLDEDDGRTWQANVGRWDQEGRFPLLRFALVADEGTSSDDAAASDPTPDPAAPVTKGPVPAEPTAEGSTEDPEITELQGKLDRLNRDLKVLRLRRAVEDKQKELDSSAAPPEPPTPKEDSEADGPTENTPPPQPAGGSAPNPTTTFEVIARVAGRKEPFVEAVLILDGNPVVLPGVGLSVGSAPEDGFGLGGTPGRWSDYYPNNPPESLGLPPGVGILVYDGIRGHALDPATLQKLLGPDWRSHFTP